MPPVRSTSSRSSVCPWLLWIVIAHASLKGNWLNEPMISWRRELPSTTGRVASHVMGGYLGSGPVRELDRHDEFVIFMDFGDATDALPPPPSAPDWSLLSIMTWAPILNPQIFVSGWDQRGSGLQTAWPGAGPRRRATVQDTGGCGPTRAGSSAPV